MGQIIDNRYQIIEKIGEGGMGAVYLAQHIRLKHYVAIKQMQLVGKPEELQKFKKRFEDEAREMASFQHPNIVRVIDYGQDDNEPYLILEYLSNGSLSDRMKNQPFTVEEAIGVLLPLIDALQEIHKKKLVHRDIKPSNILFDKYEQPKLADFGIVKLLEGREHTLTATGATVGTPEYMAPELIGGEASPATDQYALGVVLYELVTGKKPFKGRTPMETLTMQKYEPLPDPRSINADLPQWVCEILQKALAKEPQDRYPDINKFAQALQFGAQARDFVAGMDGVQVKTEDVATAVMPAEDNDRTFDALGEAQPVSQATILPTKKPIKETVTKPAPATAPIQQKKSIPAWLLWGGVAVIVLGLMIGIGSSLVNLGTRGSGPLSALASATSPATFTHTPTLTHTATVTNTPTPTNTPTTMVTQTPIFTSTQMLGIGSTMIREKDGMEMMYVPAGEFTMGSNIGDIDEKPIHAVYLDAYWIDKYEVTNAQYAIEGACSRPFIIRSSTRDSYFRNPSYDHYPVINVNWFFADDYCRWTGARLPSEAEWEKAATSQQENGLYPWGSRLDCSLVNYSQDDIGCKGDTNPVNEYHNGASLYGVLGMAGNVWEWVADWYDNTYYSKSPLENPSGPSSGSTRVQRGGSWDSIGVNLRITKRSWGDPSFFWNKVGFRCASSP